MHKYLLLFALLMPVAALAQTNSAPPTSSSETSPLSTPSDPGAPASVSATQGHAPSAMDFAPRLGLVTLGAAAGEALLGLAGALAIVAGGSRVGLGEGIALALVSPAAGAMVGALVVGGLIPPGLTAASAMGAVLGAVVGLVAMVALLQSGWLIYAMPTLGVAVGFGIGDAIGQATSAHARVRPPTVAVAGVRLAPLLALLPGGGRVGVAASF